MPTVLRSGPYRIYFYSHDSDEPPRKLYREICSAKFWLTVDLRPSIRLFNRELRSIRRLSAKIDIGCSRL